MNSFFFRVVIYLLHTVHMQRNCTHAFISPIYTHTHCTHSNSNKHVYCVCVWNLQVLECLSLYSFMKTLCLQTFDIYIIFPFSLLSPLPNCSLWRGSRRCRGRGRGGRWLDRGCSHPVVCGVCGAGYGLQWLVEGEAIPWVAEPHWTGAEIPGGAW